MCLLLCRQWAAVTIHLSLTRLPPQKGEKAGGLVRNWAGALDPLELSMILEVKGSSLAARPARLLSTAW